MRVQFLGACRTVTGTCHLLDVNGTRVALDCGLFQGRRDAARAFNGWVPDALRDVDAVVLSHGHLDHCGKLPVLANAGFDGPIFCTAATADTARVVLNDAAEIPVEDAEYLNKRQRGPGEPPVRPLYTVADALKVQRRFSVVDYAKPFRLPGGGDVTVTLFDAGHILGSAYVQLEWSDAGTPRALLFTADVGRFDSPILLDPAPLPRAYDVVITESTYGDKHHGPIADVGPQLLDAVRAVIARRGRMIVPSFAVGRTQTILWYLQKFVRDGLLPPTRVYVDSPMGVEMSEVYSRHRDNYDAETAGLIGDHDLFGLSRVTFARSGQQSRDINADRGPCVIVASSPTCEFGRVVHHLQQSIERENDAIVFVGWTPYDTLGRKLQDGAKRVKLFDRFYDVRCEVRTLHGLSAHADGDELERFLKPTLKPNARAFVVHGEVGPAEAFASRLTRAGVGSATVPAVESSVFV